MESAFGSRSNLFAVAAIEFARNGYYRRRYSPEEFVMRHFGKNFDERIMPLDDLYIGLEQLPRLFPDSRALARAFIRVKELSGVW